VSGYLHVSRFRDFEQGEVSSLLWVAEGVIVSISMDMMGKTEITNPAGNQIPVIRPVTSLYTSEDRQ